MGILFGTEGEITTVPIKEIVGTDYNYMMFTHNGNSDPQTSYSVDFTELEGIECDILIVGGGGGGGSSFSGNSSVPGAGGGAGELIFLINQTIPSGIYTIKVGKGGESDIHTDSTHQKGKNDDNSSFSYSLTEAIGGGGGASRDGTVKGGDGGSGGGSVINISAAQLAGAGEVSNIIKYDGTVIIENYRQGNSGGYDFSLQVRISSISNLRIECIKMS